MIILAAHVIRAQERRYEYVLVDKDCSFRIVTMRSGGLQRIAVPVLEAPRRFGQRVYTDSGTRDTSGRPILQ